MSTAALKPQRLAWVPAILVLLGSALTVAGFSLIPSATGAPDPTSNVTVNGVVTSETGITSACGVGATPFDATISFAANFDYAANENQLVGCNILFSTNAPAGAHLSGVDSTAGDQFFCRQDDANPDTPDCSANAYDRFEDGSGTTAVPAALGEGEFGIALESVSGTNGAAMWAADGNGDVTGTTEASFVNPPQASSDMCEATAPSTSVDCRFEFGGDAGSPGATAAGNYSGTLNTTVTAQ